MTRSGSPRSQVGARRRAVTVGEIIDCLEFLAPAAMSSQGAPFGLQVGSAVAAVRTVVLAPFASLRAIEAATSQKASLLVTAAPLVADGEASLAWDGPVGDLAARLTRSRVSLYVLPDSVAAAQGGLDDSLSERLGIAGTVPLLPTQAERQFKFVVFVPASHVNAVRRVAAEAGAGVIGAYSNCSFVVAGTGTFLPRAGARPTVGEVGRLEETDEQRLEMLVAERELHGVIAAVLSVHPYEEVAYDVYPVRNPGVLFGRGRIGDLPLHVSLETVLAQVNDALGLAGDARSRCIRMPAAPIGSIAVASGDDQDASLLWEASRRGAGAFVTGCSGLRQQMVADGLGTAVIEVGYAASVRPGLEQVADQLRATFASEGLQVLCAP